jgi:hypothetical protein
MMTRGAKPLEMTDVVGCWRLERALIKRGDVITPNPIYGPNPTGFLHYLPEYRVAVTIPLGPRRLMSSTDRRGGTIEELAESARSFDAYAGRVSFIAPDKIVHHIEVNTYQNYVGTDLVRRVELDGDLLRLFIPVYTENAVTVQRWLEWRRLASPTEEVKP